MTKFDFSLILPCYNEAQIFQGSLEKIIKTLDGTNYTWEIIFIDDNSSDNTKNLIKKALQKYSRRSLRAFYHNKNQGRGYTVCEGINYSQGKIVGFIDFDLEVGQWYLPKFIQEIEKGADVAIAWRIYDFSFKALPRWLSSKGYTFFRKLVLGLPYKDTEAGYKFFQKNKITPLIKKCNYHDWFWDTEILALAFKAKLIVREIPVAFVRRFDKTSTVKLIPDTWQYLKDILSFKLKNEQNY